MGLIATIRRLHYRYSWRLRHWWFDTAGGRNARVSIAVLGALAFVAEVGHLTVLALRPAAPHAPHQAIIGIVVMLIIAIIAAFIIASSMPKPKDQAPSDVDAPSVDDGQPVLIHFGRCRVKSPALLAWKVMGRDPIQTKSGKK
jgi:hypothetical protein